MVGPALLAVVGMGAVGGILANIALTPLTAGASLLQSYWYGSGLILGERMMYTIHWEHIKGRLDKGEDFLQVLDAEMNKDITAIANLSFKAMDDTGKLYLEQAGKSISAFIEELLSAAINPFFSGDREETPPPPISPPTSDGISYTVAELEAFNLQQLTTIINNPSDYTDSTVANAKTIKAKKLLEEQEQQEQKEVFGDFIIKLQQDETSFLQALTLVTLGNLYTTYIPSFTSTEQGMIVALLRETALFGIVSTRFASSGSAENLRAYQSTLASLRSQFQSLKLQIQSGSTSQLKQQAIIRIQNEINVQHILIWTHQLIYSR